MSVEAPQRVDLSQDDQIKQLLADLPQEEQDRVQEYLDTEHKKIIYLTQAELKELKGILSEDSSASHDADFDEFMAGQVSEGYASQDIIGDVEGNIFSPELLNTLDSEAEKILFASGGLFEGIDISASAQDTVSVSLTFALIEDIKSDPAALQEMVKQLQAGNTDLADSLLKGYAQKFTDISQVFQQQFDISGEALSIPGKGENNAIFMETDTGREFFQAIISGEITQSNIISKINQQNKDETILPNTGDIQVLKGIGTLTSEDLQAIVSGATNDDPEVDPNIAPEKAKTALEKLSEIKPFGAFLAAILEALQGIVNIDSSQDDTSPEPTNPNAGPDTTPIVPEQQKSVRDFFTQHADKGIFVGMNKDSILSLFPESGELSETAQNIIRQLEAIPGEESLQDKMNNLFVSEVNLSDTDSSAGQVPRMTRFLQDMQNSTEVSITLKNSDGTLNSEKLLTAVNAYRSYRVENDAWKKIPENATKNRNMTYKEFFEANQTDTVE